MSELEAGICPICGSPILGRNGIAVSPDYRHVAWAIDAVLLDGPRWPSYRSEPRIMEAQHVPSEAVNRYDLLTCLSHRHETMMPDGSVEELESVTFYPKFDDDNTEAPQRRHLVIHSACEEMAIRFMLTCRQRCIRSMGAFWMTLDLRCSATPWYTGGVIRDLMIPLVPGTPMEKEGVRHDMVGLARYFAPPHFLQPGRGWWNYDPIDIPDISAALLSNLEETEPVCDESTEFRRLVGKLPYEIQAMIVSLLLEDNFALECNYLMPQGMWRDLFFQIPFLWDVDQKMMEDRTVPTGVGGGGWDWERLSRQLLVCPTALKSRGEESGSDGKFDWIAWDYGDVGLAVPPGLTNRRRIWQILMEMYPNDVGLTWEMEEFPTDMPVASSDEERAQIWQTYLSSRRGNQGST